MMHVADIRPREQAGACAPPVRLVGTPHPLRMDERVELPVPAGPTLLELVTEACDKLRVPALFRGYGFAWVDGRPVAYSQWGKVRPAPGQVVVVTVAPGNSGGGGGGGGKDAGRVLMTIAVAAAAIYTAGAASTFLLQSTWASVGITTATTIGQIGGAIVGMGVAALGMAAVNAMVPVRAANLGSLSGLSGGGGASATEASYNITGMQNQADPYGAIPLALGTVRWAPNHAAMPYTENVENERFVRGNFDWGLGPLVIEDMCIGDTALEEYECVEEETTNGADGVVPSLYSNTVVEEAFSVVLEPDEPVERTTQPDIDEFSVDIMWPRLARYSGINPSERTCVVELKWRKVGETAWHPTSFIAGRGLWHLADCSPQWGTHLFLVVVDTTNLRVSFRRAFTPLGGTLKVPTAPEGWKPVAMAKRHCEQLGTPSYSIEETYEPDGWSGLEVTINEAHELWVADGQSTTHPFHATAASSDPVYRTQVVRPGERGQFEVQLTRTTPASDSSQVFDEVQFSALRSIVDEPAVNVDFPNARTELRIKASGELNGTVDRLNGLTTTVCLDYDHVSDIWVERPTNNPASLYRHVVQSAAGARPRTDAELDLAALEDFHDWCRENDFTYNEVRKSEADVWEVLMDICGAGRASPHSSDGLWTVVIDRPRDSVALDITRDMCWGFKGARDLRQMPHALRVSFVNADTWESDEILVYGDGYDETNATLLETLKLPGVTNSEHAWKLGRYHLAVMDLRREVYTWNMDWAHLSFRRGDLVTVCHPVPMWGLTDGRIKAVEDLGGGAWRVTTDEPCIMEAGKTYCIRLITEDNERSVRAVATEAGETYELELPAESGVLDPDVGWRFAFGEEGKETNEVLIVKKPTTGPDFSAELTGVDYSPGVYLADQGEIPPWDPNITRSPFVAPQAPDAPRILALTSDDSVMARGADGTVQSRVSVAYALACGKVPAGSVQGQIRPQGGGWRASLSVSPGKPVVFGDVEEGRTYEVRLRSVSAAGAASAWTGVQAVVASGKELPPEDVTNFSAQQNGAVCTFKWQQVSDLDLQGYELRFMAAPFVWGNARVISSVTRGTLVTNSALPPGEWVVGIKAVDTSKNYSENAATCPITVSNVYDVVDVAAAPAWLGTATDLIEHPVSGVLVPTNTKLASEEGWETFDMFLPDAVEAGYYTFNEFDLGFDTDVRVWGTLDGALGPGETVGAPDLDLEIRWKKDGGSFGAWTPWNGGIVEARYIQARVRVSPGQGAAYVSALTVTVDVQERTERGEALAVEVGGTAVAYGQRFRVVPNVMAQAVGTTALFPIVSDITAEGFTVQVFDSGGTDVGGTVNWTARGA